MNTEILTQNEKITKWVVAIDATTDLTGQPDNVYPFAGGVEDQWAVVMNETQIAWAAEYGTACMIYVSALQTRREHAQRCPTDAIPFNGYHADAVPAPPIGSTVVTQADIDAVNEGNKPGAWRAKSIEQMPSGWTRTVIQ